MMLVANIAPKAAATPMTSVSMRARVIIAAGKDVSKARALVMGATFKENVDDIRNSKVADVVKELQSYGVQTDVVDPRADSNELQHEYGFGLLEKPGTGYDAVIVAVNHSEYQQLDEAYFRSLLQPDGLVVDIKGMYKGKIQSINYWSL